MRTRTKTPLLRLPTTLTFTALGVAVAGTLACGGQSSSSSVDAAIDVREDAPVVADATADSTADSIADAMADDVVTNDDACLLQYECIPLSGDFDGSACPPHPICSPSDCPDAECMVEPLA
jgi:hypothetical protein